MAQVETVKPATLVIEPGLEQAVKWPWKVEPSAAEAWGLSIEEPVVDPAGNPSEPGMPKKEGGAVPVAKIVPKGPPPAMLEHVVVKGDSLTVIARAHGVTVDQLRIFNDLKNDRIVLGKVVKVPGADDIKAMIEIAVAAEKAAAKDAPKATPKKAPAPLREVAPVLIATKPHRALPPAAWGAASLVLIQSFLDRQGFTIGPIDGTAGPMYDAAYKAFEKAHPGELHTPEGQSSAAMKAIGGPYVEYVLSAADMRWISPHPGSAAGGKVKGKSMGPLPTLEELTHESFMAYRSGWEFVAERFHAAESFLRNINPGVKNGNVPGAVFLVPNVLPFEIENALAEPLQPAADPAAPISASMLGVSRLVIRRGDVVIASMPVSSARPGLRGRKIWKILDVVARPRLASMGDAAAPMTVPYRLAAGPNNPVGIVWINLAKSGDPQPLPYGLHGTSIPGTMMKQESVGGFRMTNWDIARAVRLLPVGTELKWE
ncbi:LysM peptidoglycan-binding domain-containing protein [Prosthecobacter sp.]|uniref:L,D-transpeptidase family protein n=1 Tax=Prosthecobacter sp. TaxID=1965333 RepID=UPI0024885209|nr:LysM peptidoglycan-binding domain-containing protein [Prosthecobacter sp.]MDI1312340.1 LysM peptidoglycan-binding domain-containing protein [Prosthecobacter sp.]